MFQQLIDCLKWIVQKFFFNCLYYSIYIQWTHGISGCDLLQMLADTMVNIEIFKKSMPKQVFLPSHNKTTLFPSI